MELRYWLVPGNVKNNRINQLNEKRSLILWGLRVPIWKINFSSRVLRLSVFPWCREMPQTAICCIEWFGRLKCLATGLDAFLSSFSISRRCSRNRSPSRLPVSPIYNFLQRVQVIQWRTLAEVQVKWSVILMDRLGSDNFSTLQMKGHVLHRARAYEDHVKSVEELVAFLSNNEQEALERTGKRNTNGPDMTIPRCTRPQSLLIVLESLNSLTMQHAKGDWA